MLSLTLSPVFSDIPNPDAQVEFEKPNMDLEQLLRYGNLLVDEQENVRRVQLADSYLKGAELVGSGNGAGAKQALLS